MTAKPEPVAAARRPGRNSRPIPLVLCQEIDRVVELESGIIYRSRVMRDLITTARRAAEHSISILIVGATGTGKELLARQIHSWSGRSGRLVDINCGALPREMVESLLFGHRRGSFTGATGETEGLIQAAAGGTLFLDELSSLPLPAQAALLRVLETHLVRQLGSTVDCHVEFRVVAATLSDVKNEVQAGTFRQDLYQRVAGLVLTMPPLSGRSEDILPLATHFAGTLGCDLSSGCDAVLRNYSWPGNVRELRHVIERATFLAEGTVLTSESLVLAVEHGAPHGMQAPVKNDISREVLLSTCRENGWRADRIASALGVSRATAFRRLKAVGISLRHGVRGGAESQ